MSEALVRPSVAPRLDGAAGSPVAATVADGAIGVGEGVTAERQAEPAAVARAAPETSSRHEPLSLGRLALYLAIVLALLLAGWRVAWESGPLSAAAWAAVCVLAGAGWLAARWLRG